MTPFELDPFYWHVCRWLVAGVFALALAHKLRSPRAFAAIVREYALVPAAAAPALTGVVVVLEGGVVAGLAVEAAVPAAAGLAVALLAAYAGGIALNLARGRRDIDCGCFGPLGYGSVGARLTGDPEPAIASPVGRAPTRWWATGPVGARLTGDPEPAVASPVGRAPTRWWATAPVGARLTGDPEPAIASPVGRAPTGPAAGADSHALSGWLLLRNLALGVPAALLLLPVADRELATLDLGGIAVAAAVALVTYAAADQLAANAPRLARPAP